MEVTIEVANSAQSQNDAVALGISLIAALLLALIFRYAVKMKWLTAISLGVVLVPLPGFLATLIIGNDRAGITMLKLLPWANIFLIILVIQFFRWRGSGSGGREAKVNTEERQRILDMMKQGKISSAEGEKLLDAMGQSSA